MKNRIKIIGVIGFLLIFQVIFVSAQDAIPVQCGDIVEGHFDAPETMKVYEINLHFIPHLT